MSAYLQAQLKLPYNSSLWFSENGLLRHLAAGKLAQRIHGIFRPKMPKAMGS
jgi:hypothetical protein